MEISRSRPKRNCTPSHSRTADADIGQFLTVPRSLPGRRETGPVARTARQTSLYSRTSLYGRALFCGREFEGHGGDGPILIAFIIRPDEEGVRSHFDVLTNKAIGWLAPDNQSVILESDRKGRLEIFRQKLTRREAALLVSTLGDVYMPQATPGRQVAAYDVQGSVLVLASPTTRPGIVFCELR